jgi:hypothetical protein
VDRADFYAPYHLYPGGVLARSHIERTTAMARTIAAKKMFAYSTLVVRYGVAAAVVSTGVILSLTIQAARFM